MLDLILNNITWVAIAIALASGIKINKEWEKAVILRLGRYKRTQGAGLYYVIPIIELRRVLDTRTQVMDVAKQKIITKDSVAVEVDAVVYYHIKEDEVKKAILNVERWENASTILSQTTLRDIVGQHPLDDLLTQKDATGKEIKEILDKGTDAWGIKIETVEIKDVIIPKDMERAMAKEAEATREARARVTKANGEFEASKKLRKAGEILAKGKSSLNLRMMQTLQEIGAEQNSLIIVVPSDMAKPETSLGLTALGKHELEKQAKPTKENK